VGGTRELSPTAAAIDAAVNDALGRGDVNEATRLVLEQHGPEVLRLLMSIHRDETAAADVFAVFAEGVWRGLPAYRGAASLRTWAFAIARRASLHYRRDVGRRAARQVPLADEIEELAERVRTATLSHLRSERKSRLMALRDTLEPDERALLFLRLDRGLAWNDLAVALHDGDAPLEGADLKRDAARLRKRFQSLKERLRELARREGLL
jgi:RNA polymerase sigma-70 factor (ECF subfamily)